MKKTDALIILDGLGFTKETHGNAVSLSGIPNITKLMSRFPHTLLNSSGLSVGLPEGQMGNSEVGHLNIGAGRVIYQDITRIGKSINDGDFFTNPAFLGAAENCKKNDSALHLVGLLSSGGVHSMNTHLYALIRLAKKEGLKKVYVHCITDGRDTPPSSAVRFIADLENEIEKINCGKIATVVGRYYYMDRDKRWERVERGYNCVFSGEGNSFNYALDAVKTFYAKGITDEFMEPCVIGGYQGVNENDSIIFYNFRADRAREITEAAIYPDFDKFKRKGNYKKTYYVGMTQYDDNFVGIYTAYGPKVINNTLGEYLAAMGKKQTRIAETEKYAHVTFFFNGGVESPNSNEERILVPSPRVPTYDLKPEMSAEEVTEAALKVIGETDVLIINFANCDMVGHTGVMDAAVKAVEVVDKAVKKLVDKILEAGGSAIITSDHGNAEQMKEPDGSPMTAHTTNQVPLIVASNKYRNVSLKEGGALCDIAPTLLFLMDLNIPNEMDGKNLILV